jgi:DNA-binding XRE family transcriptional regulator
VSAEANERWHQGDALRKARVERGLTLSEQAAILGVAPKALNDVEFGRRSLEELVDGGEAEVPAGSEETPF